MSATQNPADTSPKGIRNEFSSKVPDPIKSGVTRQVDVGVGRHYEKYVNRTQVDATSTSGAIKNILIHLANQHFDAVDPQKNRNAVEQFDAYTQAFFEGLNYSGDYDKYNEFFREKTFREDQQEAFYVGLVAKQISGVAQRSIISDIPESMLQREGGHIISALQAVRDELKAVINPHGSTSEWIERDLGERGIMIDGAWENLSVSCDKLIYDQTALMFRKAIGDEFAVSFVAEAMIKQLKERGIYPQMPDAKNTDQVKDRFKQLRAVKTGFSLGVSADLSIYEAGRNGFTDLSKATIGKVLNTLVKEGIPESLITKDSQASATKEGEQSFLLGALLRSIIRQDESGRYFSTKDIAARLTQSGQTVEGLSQVLVAALADGIKELQKDTVISHVDRMLKNLDPQISLAKEIERRTTEKKVQEAQEDKKLAEVRGKLNVLINGQDIKSEIQSVERRTEIDKLKATITGLNLTPDERRELIEELQKE